MTKAQKEFTRLRAAKDTPANRARLAAFCVRAIQTQARKTRKARP